MPNPYAADDEEFFYANWEDYGDWDEAEERRLQWEADDEDYDDDQALADLFESR